MHEDSRPHYTTAPPTASKLSIRSFAAWGLVAVTSVIALTGAYYWGASNAAITEIEIVIPTPEPAVVQVVGEVRAPGVYELNLDARVLDAIDAAGGMTENAAIESINLAATVNDGSRILVPVIPSATPTSIADSDVDVNPGSDAAHSSVPTSGDALPAESSGYPIDLNSATVDQLMSLPSIGDTRANQIIVFRTAIGGFSTLEQLLEISGIGAKTLEAIRPLVVVR